MSRSNVAELSRAVNSEARKQYPQLVKLLGVRSLMLTSVTPRLELRSVTPYPYTFSEDNSLLPTESKSFGRIIKRGRREGLEEIHATIENTDKEHSWLFIPSDSLWVDITLESDETSVKPDPYAQIFLSHIYTEVEFIHTHPDATVRNLAVWQPWYYSDNYLLEAAQPSGTDLTYHSQMVARTSPDSRQVSTIVSHFGITSFVMNGDQSTSGVFHAEAYDRLVQDASEPTSAIRQALGRLGVNALRNDDTPAFTIGFTPLG
ncbi:hypothetical protein H6794_03485 [Candidatus Nomurabacteria bacterium]|nr:hypothetical protein [Candidatus Nomurabacteria bacterium]